MGNPGTHRRYPGSRGKGGASPPPWGLGSWAGSWALPSGSGSGAAVRTEGTASAPNNHSAYRTCGTRPPWTAGLCSTGLRGSEITLQTEEAWTAGALWAEWPGTDSGAGSTVSGGHPPLPTCFLQLLHGSGRPRPLLLRRSTGLGLASCAAEERVGCAALHSALSDLGRGAGARGAGAQGLPPAQPRPLEGLSPVEAEPSAGSGGGPRNSGWCCVPAALPVTVALAKACGPAPAPCCVRSGAGLGLGLSRGAGSWSPPSLRHKQPQSSA